MKKYFVVLMVVCLSMGLLLAGCKKGSSNDSSEGKGSGYSENGQANNGAPLSPAEDPELQVITEGKPVLQYIPYDHEICYTRYQHGFFGFHARLYENAADQQERVE